jgi:hypothetical protein
MGCCSQDSVTLAPGRPDPSSHVNYAKGMVLGVDDFTQEFAYLSGRDRWLAREAIGYGTLSGLTVTLTDGGAEGPKVNVGAGSALTPSGKLVCVGTAQCAFLDAWLAKTENAKQVAAIAGVSSPPADIVPLYLTLCYRDCLTAPVPIPGEPCRAESALMAPSRVTDSYQLTLSTKQPRQLEQQALRDFVTWLRQVAVVDAASPPASESELVAALRTAAQPWFDAYAASPPLSPPISLADYLFGSPPASLQIAAGELGTLLRAAMRLWVTELRPLWQACCCACAGNEAAEDDCLLLARIDVPVINVAGVWSVDSTRLSSLQVVEDDRATLVHLALLQEWLLSAPEPVSPAATGVQIQVDLLNASETLGVNHHCVICTADAISIGLPEPAPAHRGRVYIVKNAFAASPPGSGVQVVLASSPPAPIETLADGQSATYVCDGVSAWHRIAAA